MKNLIKKVLFGSSANKKILTGVSSGLKTSYDPQDRAMHLVGIYEREIHPYIKSGIRKANTLIDIGANDGYYALAFLKQKKETILYEPGVEEKELLRKNLLLNGFQENIDYKLFEKFVSGASSETEISINDVVKDKSRIFILLDIEGAEENVINNFDFNNTAKIEWLIETHSFDIEKAIVNRFTLNGYKVKIIKNAWWRSFLPENRPLAHNRWLFATKY